MAADNLVLLFFLFLLIATLYSSVGHAGASGYLAVMALVSFPSESIKPTSLLLNILVAAIASYKFIKEGYFDRKIFFAFVLTSLPMAFLGGYITVDPKYFKLIAGLFLVISAGMLLIKQYIRSADNKVRSMPLPYGIILGSLIGLLSGLVGVGGGIFLSPILIMANWTTAKRASGVAALFILFNSVAGLAGHLSALHKVDVHIAWWAPAVVIGGFVGSWLGTKRFSNKAVIYFLFAVLLSAGLKFIFFDFLR